MRRDTTAAPRIHPGQDPIDHGLHVPAREALSPPGQQQCPGFGPAVEARASLGQVGVQDPGDRLGEREVTGPAALAEDPPIADAAVHEEILDVRPGQLRYAWSYGGQQ